MDFIKDGKTDEAAQFLKQQKLKEKDLVDLTPIEIEVNNFSSSERYGMIVLMESPEMKFVPKKIVVEAKWGDQGW